MKQLFDMGIDYDKDDAILKSYLGNYPKLQQKGKILISLADPNKPVLIPYLKALYQGGYQFCATKGTAQFIRKQGIPCELIAKINEQSAEQSLLNALKDDSMVMVFNTPINQGNSKSDGELIRNTAIQYGIPCFTREENIRSVMEAVVGSSKLDIKPISLQELKES